MNSGSRLLTRSPTSAKVAVCPPTWARAGTGPEHGRDHLGAEPLDRVERGAVLRSGGRERDERRDAGVGVDLGRCDGGDAPVGRIALASGSTTLGSLRDVDGDDQRPVDARPEAVGDEVVGPTLGAVLRQGALVGEAELQRQHRRGQRQQHDRDADGVRPGVPGHVPTPAPPAQALSARRRRRFASAPEAVDPVPRETEERRQQGDRGDHHDQHDHRDGDAGGGHERHAGDGEAEDRDDDGAAGEDDGLTGGGDGPADRLLDGQAAGEVLAVPGDEEQRVVDPDAEADHAADLRRPARDVDQVGDQRHRADAEGEAEERHPDRQAHRDDRPERDEQDDDRGDQADQLADARSPAPRRRRTGRRRSRPAAGSPRRSPATERLEVLQVAGSSSSSTGYWTRIRATRPSAEIACRLSRADRAHRVAGPTTADGVCTSASAAARVRGVEERRVLVAWRQHHLSGEPGPVRPGRRQQVGGLLRVEARRPERVLELLAERARRADDDHRHDEPGPDDGPRAPGGEATQPVQSMRHDGVLLR